MDITLSSHEIAHDMLIVEMPIGWPIGWLGKCFMAGHVGAAEGTRSDLRMHRDWFFDYL